MTFPVLRATVVACAALALATSAAPMYAAGRHAQGTTIFRPVLPALRHTGVPLLLPTLPSLNRYFATIELAKRSQYAILLGYTRGCLGDACEYGELTAQKLSQHPPVVGGVRVNLAGGRTGIYHNFTCGASCGASTVTVNVSGYQYSFGIKGGKKAAVLRMTNSALLAGPAG